MAQQKERRMCKIFRWNFGTRKRCPLRHFPLKMNLCGPADLCYTKGKEQQKFRYAADHTKTIAANCMRAKAVSVFLKAACCMEQDPKMVELEGLSLRSD